MQYVQPIKVFLTMLMVYTEHFFVSAVDSIFSSDRVYFTAITCKSMKCVYPVQSLKRTIRVRPASPERSSQPTARPRARIAWQTRTRRRRPGTRRACRARRTRCLCPEAPRRRHAIARPGMRMWRAWRRARSVIRVRGTASSGARRARTALWVSTL